MEYQLYINGKWKNTESGSVVSDLNPADGSVYAQVHFAGPAEVEEAVAAADHAWKSWAETPAADKEAILLKAGDWMQEHIDEVAGVLMDESGSAFGKAYFEAGFAVDLFRAAAGECRRVFGEIQQQAPGEISMIRRLPFGVVAGLAPARRRPHPAAQPRPGPVLLHRGTGRRQHLRLKARQRHSGVRRDDREGPGRRRSARGRL